MPREVRPVSIVNPAPKITKLKEKQIPENVMSSEEALFESQKILDDIVQCQENQEQVKDIYITVSEIQ